MTLFPCPHACFRWSSPSARWSAPASRVPCLSGSSTAPSPGKFMDLSPRSRTILASSRLQTMIRRYSFTTGRASKLPESQAWQVFLMKPFKSGGSDVSSVRFVETWTAWNWETLWSICPLRGRETKSVLKRLPKWLQVRLSPIPFWCLFENIGKNMNSFPLAVNPLGEDIDATVNRGKVIRPLRSVDPSQTEYQGLIEVLEEGRCLDADGKMWWTALASSSTVRPVSLIYFYFFQGEAKARKSPLESWVWRAKQTVSRKESLSSSRFAQ